MANRAHALVRRLFNFALARGLLAISPVVKIERTPETPRKRHLSAEEIRTFRGALDVASCEPNIKALLRFTLLTGRRRSEALLINAREIDRERIWCLPASRTKNGKDFFCRCRQWRWKFLTRSGPT
jgi:integrase